MENPRADKVAVVEEAREKFASADAALLTEYRGINVADMATLRRAIRAAGGDYKIYKNTLVRLAVAGADVDLSDLLTGPTAIAFVFPTDDGPADPAAVAKALKDFGRTNEHLVLKGGLLGDQLLDAAAVGALADLPSRSELFSEFAGAMESMFQDFAGLLDAKLGEFARAMEELADKGVLAEGTPAPADEPAPPPADETVVEASTGADATAAAEASTDESATDDTNEQPTTDEAPSGADDGGDDAADTTTEES